MTTVDKVKEIIDTSLTDPNIQALITSASTFVESALVGHIISEGMTNELQRWVTAHMISITKERQASEEDAGTASQKYTGKYDMYLNMTSFGQMAIAMDPTGMLATAHKKQITFIAVKGILS